METKAFSIDLYAEEIEPLTPCIKIIGSLGRIQFRILGVKETVKDKFLILLCNPNAKVLNLKE